MKTISSGSLFVTKILFPVFFAVLTVVWLFLAAAHAQTGSKVAALMVVPFMMLIFMFALMKNLVWDLADEVQDCGDYLRVRKGRNEEDIAFANIMNVNAITRINPPRITLRLVTPGRFGKEVSFSPQRPLAFSLFVRNPVAEDLIERAYAARTRR